MSNDNDKGIKPNDPSRADAKRTEEASKDAKQSATEKEELDESFPGSDAPASTRRSERD